MPDQPPRLGSRPRRSRATRRSVRVTERVARSLITAGGIGTILAVSSIFLFLLYVVAPLFLGTTVESRNELEGAARGPMVAGLDEEGFLAWEVGQEGTLRLTRLSDGLVVSETRPFGEQVPTAVAQTIDQQTSVFGYADGSIRTGRVGLGFRFLEADEEAGSFAALEPGESAGDGDGIVVRTEGGQLRATFPVLELDEALDTRNASGIEQIDMAVTPSGPMIAARHADGALRIYRVRTQRNLLTGSVTRKLVATDVPHEGREGEQPLWLGVSGVGTDLYVVYADGELLRYDLRDLSAPQLLETRGLLAGPEDRVARVTFLLGRRSILVGSTSGHLRVWFPVRVGEEEGAGRLEPAQTLIEQGPPVTALASSRGSRLLAAGDQEGRVSLFHVTSGTELVEMDAGGPVEELLFGPKEARILARTPEHTVVWEIERRYPEANLEGLFLPAWYEGYPEPAHVWQSSSGTDDFEPKLGLVPLVFGTLKATLYSMLFGAPLALLAAIFSSEFLAPRPRTRLKGVIELMASLPSVVLGFLGALVIAPFLEGYLTQALVTFYAIPFAMLLGAYAWQLLPTDKVLRWAGLQRLFMITLTIPVGLLFGWALAPAVEHLVFAGDLTGWLAGQVGTGAGGWFFLLIPLSALLMALLSGRGFGPLYRRMLAGKDRRSAARIDFVKFLVLSAATLIVAGGAALLLGGQGFDPRGHVVGTYVQRNAMIVGFVMGFAIIPIIYTLAEDALSEVPKHLREGSLGAGATPWQTATRIVIPAAMSGLFSALMIGLGRAVGETMIVLMAAGNTPIMELNIFNGFRTLSANIAVEMPEAVPNSAHYRTLFLAALVLFAMTFVLNTAAEAVRRHFRAKTRAL